MSTNGEDSETKEKEGEPNVIVSVLEHRTQIGSLICAEGHKQVLPLNQAKALEALGKVRIDGVR